MKKLATIAIVLSMGTFSCEETLYIYVEKNLTHSKVLTFDIDNTGAIDKRSGINLDNLVADLTSDIDPGLKKKDYTIKALTIQTLSFEIEKKQANTANTMNIGTFMIDRAFGGSYQEPIMKYTDVPINSNTSFLVNTFLLTSGIEKVNTVLAETLRNIGGRKFMDVIIKGTPVPANSRTSVKLDVNVTFNLQYSYCEESIFLVSGGSGKCNN